MKKTISINKKSHEKISKFCKENALIMSAWTEKILLETIKRIEENESDKSK